MGWDIMCNVFGVISILGAVILSFWYVKGAREQLDNLRKKEEESE